MQVQVAVSQNVSIMAQGESQADVFEQVAAMQEVVGPGECGKCKGTDLRFVVREVDGNKFFELRCLNPKCRAILSYGQNKGDKKGSLFPHIKENSKTSIMGLEPGTYLPDGGWLRYDPKTEKRS